MIIRHDIDPLLYIATSDQFPAIIQVPSYEDESGAFICDAVGVLIQPDWVLTAAHVAHEVLPLEDRLTIANTEYSIRQIVLHPLWQDSENMAQVRNDIALIQLTEPVPNVAPIPLYTQTDELGQVVTFVGWGEFGTGHTGVATCDDQLRTATNRIEAVNEQWLIFRFDEPPDTTDLEGISGTGDSGGPALIKTKDGWFLAGIGSGQDLAGKDREGLYGV